MIAASAWRRFDTFIDLMAVARNGGDNGHLDRSPRRFDTTVRINRELGGRFRRPNFNCDA